MAESKNLQPAGDHRAEKPISADPPVPHPISATEGPRAEVRQGVDPLSISARSAAHDSEQLHDGLVLVRKTPSPQPENARAETDPGTGVEDFSARPQALRSRWQAGHRPALVLSPRAYNERSGLMLCCPFTTQVKGYPFEVPVGRQPNVVLADQVRSLDWRVRKAERKGAATADELADVRAKIAALVGA